MTIGLYMRKNIENNWHSARKVCFDIKQTVNNGTIRSKKIEHTYLHTHTYTH